MDDTFDKAVQRIVTLNADMGNAIPISDKVAIVQAAAIMDLADALRGLNIHKKGL